MPTISKDSVQSVTVAAPAEVLYDLIADVEQMRRIFIPVIHTAYLERGESTDRVERWTWERHLDGVRTWRARRHLDRAAGRISFQHENPNPPLQAVQGEWSFKSLGENLTQVELRHEIEIDGDGEDATRAVEMLDRGAGMQLGRVKQFAEEREEVGEREVSYEAELVINQPIEDVFNYFYQADRWAERIPHCLGTRVREDTPLMQMVEMDVQVPSGAVHTTKQARACFPYREIRWRQLEGLPPLDEALYGYMVFTQTDEGVLVRAGQTEVLKPTGVAKRGWTMTEAKEHVAEVRGGRSLDALKSAEDFLKRRR
jgi:ribosome-associated toxin RatA of RatAB toxin-antitoxin module